MLCKKKSLFIYSTVFSSAFAFCRSLSKFLWHNDAIGIELSSFVISFLIAQLVFITLYIFIAKIRELPVCALGSMLFAKLWLRFFAAFTAVYGACYLVYYPGTASNDSLYILRNGMMMANQHPVWYCFLITIMAKIGLYAGSLRIGFHIYIITQLLLVSGECAYLASWFWTKRSPKPIKWFVLLFLLFYPVLPVFSICMIKDTVFSVSVAVLATAAYDIVMADNSFSKRNSAVIYLSLILIMVYRNNGIYIAVAFLILLLIFQNNRKAMKTCLFMFLIIVLFLSGGQILKKRFDVGELFKETAAIPIQQVSAVVRYDGVISESQQQFIDTIIPLETIRSEYARDTADMIKWNAEFNDSVFNNSKSRFLKTWLELLPDNLYLYARAYLWETYWYWAPEQTGKMFVYYGTQSLDSQWHAETGIVEKSVFPDAVNNVMKSYYSLASVSLREGALLWIVLLTTFLNVLFTGKSKVILFYVPVLLNWLTLMISAPVNTSIRYSLCLVCFLPLAAGALFISNAERENERCTLG